MVSPILRQVGFRRQIRLDSKYHKEIVVPNVILNVAVSVDEFIADSNGGVDWLPGADSDPNDTCGMNPFKSRISVIVMGNTSYQQILTFGEWAWSDKLTYVFTSREDLTSENKQIRFVHGSPEEWINTIKQSADDKDIWLLGGAKLAHAFFRQRLIDEVVLTVIPKSLGAGIKLDVPYGDFDLVSESICASGMTQRYYQKKLSLEYKARLPSVENLVQFGIRTNPSPVSEDKTNALGALDVIKPPT